MTEAGDGGGRRKSPPFFFPFFKRTFTMVGMISVFPIDLGTYFCFFSPLFRLGVVPSFLVVLLCASWLSSSCNDDDDRGNIDDDGVNCNLVASANSNTGLVFSFSILSQSKLLTRAVVVMAALLCGVVVALVLGLVPSLN